MSKRETYAASEVARRLDIEVGALRRRPDVKPERTVARHRRYSPSLISQLEMELMSEAIGAGWKVSHSHQLTATAPDGWTTTFDVSDPLWTSDQKSVRQSLGGMFRLLHAQKHNEKSK